MEIEGLSVDDHAGTWQVIIFSEESEVIYKITVLRHFPSSTRRDCKANAIG